MITHENSSNVVEDMTYGLSTLVPFDLLLRGYSRRHTNTPAALDIYVKVALTHLNSLLTTF